LESKTSHSESSVRSSKFTNGAVELRYPTWAGSSSSNPVVGTKVSNEKEGLKNIKICKDNCARLKMYRLTFAFFDRC
jgi:hypothetical protein